MRTMFWIFKIGAKASKPHKLVVISRNLLFLITGLALLLGTLMTIAITNDSSSWDFIRLQESVELNWFIVSLVFLGAIITGVITHILSCFINLDVVASPRKQAKMTKKLKKMETRYMNKADKKVSNYSKKMSVKKLKKDSKKSKKEIKKSV